MLTISESVSYLCSYNYWSSYSFEGGGVGGGRVHDGINVIGCSKF